MPGNYTTRRATHSAPTPAAFADIADHIVTLQAALDRAKAERDELVREARAVGVPFAALERWAGVSRRRLDQIAHGRITRKGG